jgi:hypothetical protein
MKRLIITIILIFCLLPSTNFSRAAMSGGDYSIPVDAFTVFEGDESTGGDYSLDRTGGEFFAGNITGGTYTLKAGFQAILSNSLDYQLSETSISLDFGSSPQTTLASDSLVVGVTTDSLTGYTLSLAEDGNLVSGVNDINDVSDGDVTIGSEEYGINTTGNDAMIVSDTAISGSVTIAKSTIPTEQSETTVNFEAAASVLSKAGTYTQTLTFTITTNP